MTDTTKLKELAELASKATPGPWWIDSHGHCMVSESQDHRTVFLTNDGMGPATRHPETGNLSHWPNDWDASYIASADPTTILALIAEVERLRARLEIDDRTPYDGIACRDETIKGLDEKCDRLKAENEALRSALQAVHAEVDGNIRPLTRDLVNMVSGVKNGSHPNDIYDHCDEIDRIIDAALEGGAK